MSTPLTPSTKMALLGLALASSQTAFALSNDLQTAYSTITLPFSQAIGDTFNTFNTFNTFSVDTQGNVVYKDSTNHLVGDSTGEYRNVGPTSPGTQAFYDFYDDFVFTMPGTNGSLTASAVSVSFQNIFGINNLQARLYDLTGSALTTGSPTNGAVYAWSSSMNVGGSTLTVSTFNAPIYLQSGHAYTLEIRGDVFGPTASYSGNINIQDDTPAVPENESWALAFIGLALIGMQTWRRI